MKARKNSIVGIVVVILLAVFFVFYWYSNKTSINVAERIENENMDDISLKIYYLSPYDLMLYPVSSVEDLIQRCEKKFVIYGSELEENIDLFKQIDDDDLKPVLKKTSDLDLRVYYVIESKKNGKLLDVAMWGEKDDTIFVNGTEVEENDVFYDVIIPFLPEEEAEELKDYIK